MRTIFEPLFSKIIPNYFCQYVFHRIHKIHWLPSSLLSFGHRWRNSITDLTLITRQPRTTNCKAINHGFVWPIIMHYKLEKIIAGKKKCFLWEGNIYIFSHCYCFTLFLQAPIIFCRLPSFEVDRGRRHDTLKMHLGVCTVMSIRVLEFQAQEYINSDKFCTGILEASHTLKISDILESRPNLP